MSEKYYCNRCEETFTDKLELAMHFWLTHGLTLVEAQRETDSKEYGGINGGCKEASDYLGYPSSCSNCPFSKCVYDEPRQREKQRDRDIRRLYKEGATIPDIASVYNVGERTVQRAISKVRKVNA